MKAITLFLLFTLVTTIAAADVSEKVKLLLDRYLDEFEVTGDATILVGKEREGYRWAYWKEKKLLIQIPKEIEDIALRHPSLVIRKPLEYPTDVRKEEDRELESSTYLVTYEWYHDRLIEILKEGDILHIKKGPNGEDE
ncbi:MAG: hypothetical protein AAGH40_02930 [Verrucomicrobiota bacterium]